MESEMVYKLFHDIGTVADAECSEKPCQIMHITTQIRAENKYDEEDTGRIKLDFTQKEVGN